MTGASAPVADLPDPPPAKITSADVRAGLLKTFGGEATNGRYTILFEVSNATATSRSRSADAIIMSCWPSDGLELHGVEIKVARSDWMNELRNPKKAEDIAKFCDRWWLVTAPGVVKDESEIPPAWGWRVWDGKRLTTMKKADRTPSEQPTRLFLASVLRNAGRVSGEVLDRERRAVRESVQAEVNRQVAQRMKFRTDNSSRLFETVEAFEAATGIKLQDESSYSYLAVKDGSRVGAMVKALSESGLDGGGWTGGSLKLFLHQLEETAKAARQVAAAAGIDIEPTKKRGRR